MKQSSRREFLRSLTAASGLGAAAPFALNLYVSADLDRVYQLLESMETVPETDEVVERKKSGGLMQTIGSLLMLEYFWRRRD